MALVLHHRARHRGGVPVNLYERVGGEETIVAAVDDFYARVLSDPELAPFFEGARMDKLRAMQVELFSSVLGGPVEYSGMALFDAHAGRGIEARHITRFTHHLLETLLGMGVDPDDADQIVSKVTILAQDVLGETTDAE